MDEKIKLTNQDNNSGTVASYVPFYTDDNITLFNDDYRNIIDSFPPFNFIITDPPYPEKYLYCWEELGKVASRILKNGGQLFAMSGQMWFFEITDMLRKYLQPHWIIANFLPPNGGNSIIHTNYVQQAWKPIFWFKKGEIPAESHFDIIGSLKGVKRIYHKWQQNIKVFLHLIKTYTKKDCIILDPFLGSGTTALACYQLGFTNFIGCDIDSHCIKTTQMQIQSHRGIEQWMPTNLKHK